MKSLSLTMCACVCVVGWCGDGVLWFVRGTVTKERGGDRGGGVSLSDVFQLGADPPLRVMLTIRSPPTRSLRLRFTQFTKFRGNAWLDWFYLRLVTRQVGTRNLPHWVCNNG